MKTILLLATLALAGCGGGGGSYHGYDEKADAGADIKNALITAKATNRRVLVEAGGNWCSWCKIMDKFFDSHKTVTKARDEYFVTVKVAVPSGGPVPPALASYPAPAGYPHLYVLDAEGTVVHSQDTASLEAGQSYDVVKFIMFLNAHRPPKA